MNKSTLYTSMLVLLTVSACNSSDSDPEQAEVQCVTTQCIEDDNKQAIEKIYSEVINNKNSDLVDSVYAADFIQNNASITASVAGQKSYFDSLATQNPENTASIKHIVADGEYVAVHWHYSDNPDNQFAGAAKIDLYKLNAGMIVEQWDMSMDLYGDTISGNSAFSDLYVYKNTAATMTEIAEEENKVMVTDFYLDLFNNGNIELIDELLDVKYLQHNVWVPDGSAALSNYVSGGGTEGLKISLTLGQDDLVWTFSIADNLNLVDLWRVDYNEGKIVEHWDIF